MAEPGSWTLEFPYRRSLGPVVGAFFTGLRDGKVLGSVTKDGRVLVPPLEYDPETGESVEDELVDVAPTGDGPGRGRGSPSRCASTRCRRRSRGRS